MLDVKRNCTYCKYYKVYCTRYCAKQGYIIYHPELECKYFKLGFLNWLIFVLFKGEKLEVTDNCKERI